jgi:hypothetical protein
MMHTTAYRTGFVHSTYGPGNSETHRAQLGFKTLGEFRTLKGARVSIGRELTKREALQREALQTFAQRIGGAR